MCTYVYVHAPCHFLWYQLCVLRNKTFSHIPHVLSNGSQPKKFFLAEPQRPGLELWDLGAHLFEEG